MYGGHLVITRSGADIIPAQMWITHAAGNLFPHSSCGSEGKAVVDSYNPLGDFMQKAAG